MNTLPVIEAERITQEYQLEEPLDKLEFGHGETSTSNGEDDVAYPPTLESMTMAPTRDVLRAGLRMEADEQQEPLSRAAVKGWRIILCCIPYLLLACSAGFDQGANNITTSMPAFRIKFGYFDPVAKTLAIESLWISLWPALLYCGYMFGSISCSYLLDKFGPRKVAIATGICIHAAILVQAFTVSKGMLAGGKFLAGIGIGILQTVASNFTAEASSPKLRSVLTSGVGMALILGLVFGIASGAAVIANIDDGWHSWRLVLMLQSVIPAVAVILLPFSCTSPLYLVKKGRPEEAMKVLRKLSGEQDEQVLAAKLATIQYAVALELSERASTGEISMWDVLRDRVDRRRTLLATGVFIATQAGGTAFLGQGLYFLAVQGIEIQIATDITLGCLTLSAIMYPLASLISNRFGRRFVFVYMSLLHLVVIAVIGFLGFKTGNTSAGWALAVLINIGISTQALSTASSVYTLSAEIPSHRLRAKTQSIAYTVNNGLSLATTLVLPYVFQAPGYLGAKTALIFVGTLVLAIVWAYFCVPETNKRTPAEIDAMFAAGIPARKFASTDAQALLTARGSKGGDV